jgi:hypothetical protein
MPILPGQIPEPMLEKMAPAERRRLGKAGRTRIEIDQHNALKLERQDHNLFCGYLERNEYAYAHNRTDKRSTTNLGVPDFLIGCRLGLAIEFKRPGCHLTPEQEQWRRRHEARGGLYWIVYDYAKAVAILEEL